MLVAPIIHEVHFFAIHRLIHWGPLYRWIHSVHHNSINPSPWSSLSMHPVEGLLYHAVALWHLVIPSNPIVALFQLHIAGFGAVNGHLGFEKMEVTEDTAIDSHAYAHYLHHKYFEVNYGGDGLIPLDKWFGTWHDGTKEGEAIMDARFRKKRERVNARGVNHRLPFTQPTPAKRNVLRQRKPNLLLKPSNDGKLGGERNEAYQPTYDGRRNDCH